MPNLALGAGYPVLVVEGATATGTDNSKIFSPIVNPTRSAQQIKLTAIITGAGACKAKLETREHSDDAWVNFTPADSLDFVALPSQLVTIGAGQYRLNITTFAATSVNIKATLG